MPPSNIAYNEEYWQASGWFGKASETTKAMTSSSSAAATTTTTTCSVDYLQASGYIAMLGMILLVTTLTLATTWSMTPLSQLGLKPPGRGLWSWLVNHTLFSTKYDSGVYGYDAIQGALAPPLRLQCHVAALLFLWSLITIIFGNAEVEDAACVGGIWEDVALLLPRGVWNCGCYALVVYSTTCIVLQYCMDGVSMPGGPRVFKLGRTPQWKDETIKLDNAVATKWKCVVAQASHEDTHAKFSNDGNGNDNDNDHQQVRLTGEAAGRQIWTTRGNSTTSMGDMEKLDKSAEQDNVVAKLWKTVSGGGGGGGGGGGNNNNNTSKLDDKMEELIQTMAKGGRKVFGGFNPAENPNSCDQLFRAQQIRNFVARGGTLPDVQSKPTTIPQVAKKAAHFYSMLQCDDGHWAADYGGPHFLMPGLVTAWYVMGQPEQMLNADQIELLKHYILVHQQVDGGWGTHIESPSTMFGSTLMYVALRLLGIPADHPAAMKGRDFLQAQGGALYTSSWSKFYLCLLGCMDWKGHNSVPPEMWLLPNWFPFHPGRMWCHARMVYLPMGYLYGHRFTYDKAETDPLIQQLRQELYCPSDDYANIDWIPTRHWVASMDNYSPIPRVMKTLQNMLARYENWSVFQPFKHWIRTKGLEFSLQYIQAEDLQTNYIDIGPVNKVLNMISHFHATGGNINHPMVQNHMMRIPDYLWVAEDGMKMQGYNGSQCWDTSFCAQALFEAGLLDVFPETSQKLWSYLERTQILSTEVSQASPAYQYESNAYRQQFYRHISQGGWPFSTSAHGWPISDCTSEGLKATLCLLKSTCVQEGLKNATLKPISDERLYQAVNVLLTYQNEDGGWATYENNRGWGWYEQLNPSEVFGDIMIDYSYVECSMASLTALVDFQERYPDHRTADVQHAIDKGRDFLKSIQRDDGSWYGSWACCFTYGIWFGVEGLVKCGEPLDSPCLLDACDFLLKHQNPNGGWGEDFTSCYDKDYAKEGMKMYGDHQGSGIVNTAWALLSLSIAKCDNVDAIRRGVQYLRKRQLASGDWPQEGISGVFNRSVGITYTAYRNVFPLWALGRCHEIYGDDLEEVEDEDEATTVVVGKEDEN